jgi:hypothetical protein
VAAAALVAGMAFFAFSFATYVPRHTGLDRFGQYLPLTLALAAAFGLDALASVGQRLRGRSVRPEASDPVRAADGSGTAARAGLAGGAALVLAAAAWTLTGFADDPRIPAAGREALDATAATVPAGEAVIGNALTTGALEFFTHREAPMEGRQPLIEDPTFLVRVNELNADVHAFFLDPDDPAARAAVAATGATWFLVADEPSTLGVRVGYGGGVARMRRATGLEEAWSGRGVALFRLIDPVAAPVGGLGPARSILPQAVVGLVGWLGAFAGLAVVAGADPRRRRAPPDRASGG